MKRLLIFLLFTAPMTACSRDEPVTEAPVVESAETLADMTTSDQHTAETVVEEEQPAQTTAPAPQPTRLAQAEIDPPADPNRFQPKAHYETLTPTQPTSSSPEKIEVAEAFMYSCPHCYSFEPYLKSWIEEQPVEVEFIRIPAVFNPEAELHAKAYYTAEVLGVLDDVHDDFFREFHVNQNRLNTEEAIVEFFVDHGVDEDEFRSAFNGFAVDSKLRQAQTLARRYRIMSVPSLIVNGKYKPGGTQVKSYTGLLEVTDFLVAKEATRE